jgi:uncharacterized protein (TIGR00251 family)
VIELSRLGEGWLLAVRVSPGARRTRLQGQYGGRLKVLISSPPEQNRANLELLSFVARTLEMPRDYVSLHGGHKSKDKTLLLTGLDEIELRERLSRALGERQE